MTRTNPLHAWLNGGTAFRAPKTPFQTLETGRELPTGADG